VPWAGAVNDVEAMFEILVARYGFKAEDIRVLKDVEATRDNILAALHRHLIEPVATGDLSVFFYAGHGSQATNSKSTELDRKDETIVPADEMRGTHDIRDVVFVDTCHAGNVMGARGGVGHMTAVVNELASAASGADYRGTGTITINRLDLYISECVEEFTKGKQTPTTKPQTVADFPLALKRE